MWYNRSGVLKLLSIPVHSMYLNYCPASSPDWTCWLGESGVLVQQHGETSGGWEHLYWTSLCDMTKAWTVSCRLISWPPEVSYSIRGVYTIDLQFRYFLCQEPLDTLHLQNIYWYHRTCMRLTNTVLLWRERPSKLYNMKNVMSV